MIGTLCCSVQAVLHDPTSLVTLRTELLLPYKQGVVGVRRLSANPENLDPLAPMVIGNISMTRGERAPPPEVVGPEEVVQPSGPVTCVMTGKVMLPEECCEVSCCYMQVNSHQGARSGD